MSHRHLLLLPALLAGCALEGASPAPTQPAATTAAQPLVAPTQPTIPAPIDLKQPDPVPRLDRVEVDWTAAGSHAALPAAWLSEAQRAKVDAAPLPLLLPADEALVRAAHVSAGPRWGAWHVQADGVTARMHATDALVELPQLEMREVGEALAARPYVLTRTHQIVTVMFNRFGVGYAMDVECSRPMDDTSCTEDAYALDLYNKLAVAPRGGTR